MALPLLFGCAMGSVPPPTSQPTVEGTTSLSSLVAPVLVSPSTTPIASVDLLLGSTATTTSSPKAAIPTVEVPSPSPTPQVTVFPPSPSPTPRASATAPVPVVTPISPVVRSPAQPGEGRGKLVCLDPGHGGPRHIGAVARDPEGRVELVEKDLTLSVALLLAELLRNDGYRVVLTRESDVSLTPFLGEVTEAVRAESQARDDVCNQAGVDILVSIHFNGFDDPRLAGTETYYCPDRPFAQQSRRLAQALQSHIVAAIRGFGYAVPDRGLKNDAIIGSRFGQPHSFLLGANPGFARPSQMPGVIVEAMFLTNPQEATLLKSNDFLQVLAQGYHEGIREFFGGL
ncbi:MAG: N-acetylmuramoyl-L-alanine amidase [Chloroflexi bacterium]|nr:N-acetylmuramoyl-L-alanine amidase [Chloroflexota bacterium]